MLQPTLRGPAVPVPWKHPSDSLTCRPRTCPTEVQFSRDGFMLLFSCKAGMSGPKQVCPWSKPPLRSAHHACSPRAGVTGQALLCAPTRLLGSREVITGTLPTRLHLSLSGGVTACVRHLARGSDPPPTQTWCPPGLPPLTSAGSGA